jgi:hypothetical protein
MMMFTVAVNVRFKPFAQSIDYTDTDAVQTAGNLIRIVVEFPARMKRRKNDFEGALARLFVNVNRYAAAVVFHRTASVNVNTDDYRIASAGHRLVYGVVKHFINQMMQSALLAVADIHLRPLANSFKARENLYIAGVVTMVFHIGVLLSLRSGFVILNKPAPLETGNSGNR